jgi:hypothetical protein
MSAGGNLVGKGSASQHKKKEKEASSGKWAFMMVLFSTTIFVSAALLFLIEPMFAKFVLPSFGGTPAVWTGSMMFFQAALLTSYLYVHATTTWLGARRQAVLHLLLVLLPLLVLPVAVPAGEWAPPTSSNPILYLLGLLLVSIGLPFFALAATNPLIQRWLADTDHPAAADPYFLYRASNLGSVLGLLGYPLLLEPSMRLANQGLLWSLGYGLLVVLVFASAVVLWRSAPAPAPEQSGAAEQRDEAGPVTAGSSALEASLAEEEPEASPGGRPTVLRRLRWVGLTFVPSSLMLGVTAFITTDITPIPLLWVIPLSLYLFSFVVVFSRSERTPAVIHKAMVAALPAMMALLVVTILTEMRNPYWLLILLHILGFFVVAMVMHGEVARDRPPARYLTEFYLWVAVGGVLGGVFNALIAPVAFHTVVEYPLTIVLACLFLPGAVLAQLVRPRGEEQGRRDEEGEEDGGPRSGTTAPRRLLDPRVLDLALPLALGVGVWALSEAIDAIIAPEYIVPAFGILIGLAAGLCCLWFAYISNRPIRFGLSIAALLVAGTISAGGATLYEERSFFGIYNVTGDEGTENAYHALVVGDTNHGAQVLGQDDPPVPIAYHDPTGPFGQLFDDALPSEATDSPIGVLGLGTGAMACYAQPGQQMTFYEIDPLIERIARDPSLFTYLRDCPGEYDVVLGDGRLKLAEAPDAEYGMIVGEAFSSDAIPVHLLTREAVELYLQKLREDGVLVFNIANRHLELEPVLGNIAQSLGLSCYTEFDLATPESSQASPYPEYKLASQYAVMAREDADLGSVPDDPRWQPCASSPDPEESAWTDDFSNLLSTFNWR